MPLRSLSIPAAVVALAACAGATPEPGSPEPAPPVRPAIATAAPADAVRAEPREPFLPPLAAFRLGMMSLKSTGVDLFRAAHPTYDGRGVVIAILDSGIDAGAIGLQTTTQAQPKLLDLRDFSGEGRVALVRTRPNGDGTVTVEGRVLTGAGRIARLAASDVWYAGTFRELPLGKAPAADLDGNGRNTDAFPLVVARATDGWAVVVDADRDGSFENDVPLRDYRGRRETLTLGARPIALAINLAEADGTPVLDFFFDTSGHGTHVAGIAAGHDLFGVPGFDGVAPGAQLLGLKIANNARGGISTNGSMVRALEYAATFAAARALPLVVNLSFGVGNEHEGRATIDSITNAFLLAHPEVVFSISAGNDGPGLSTMGFPGSAELALTVGALYPGVFARPPQPGVPPAVDVIAAFSARGGETAKPDVLAPGLAFSAVPAWNTGDEVKGGTSMASPHVAGLAALLVSAMRQEARQVTAAQVQQALAVSAAPFRRGSLLDEGAGVPRLEVAYLWLRAGHQAGRHMVRALPDGGNQSAATAAFRRAGLTSPGDTVQRFRVELADGPRVVQFVLSSDVGWLSSPPSLTTAGRSSEVRVTYRAADLASPGLYVGSVTARPLSDTLAGPAFRLWNTVVVPYDLAKGALEGTTGRVSGGGVARHFFAVPVGAGGLRVRVALADSTQRATVHLFEPNGQPFRDVPSGAGVGGDDPRAFEFVVRGEDLVLGVYELVLAATPLGGATFVVQAALPPVSIGEARPGEPTQVEVSNPGSVSQPVTVRAEHIGFAWDTTVTGRGAPAESVSVVVPAGALKAIVDVALTPELWDELTDFGVTVFDSAGQQVSQGPLNYAFGRQAFDLPESGSLAGQRLTVELFPAFALEAAAHSWRAVVRVRFLLAEGAALGEAQRVALVARGRALVPMPQPASAGAPYAPLIEVRTGGAQEAVRWVTAPR